MPVQEMVAAAKGAGFVGAGLVRAVAVSLGENPTSNPKAINHNTDGTIDVGYWQINSIHGYTQAQLENPSFNAVVAYKLSKGGTDWSPWTTVHNGRANQAMPKAREVLADPTIENAAFPLIPIPGGGLHGHVPTIPIPGGGLSGVASWADGLKKFLGTVTSASFWVRVGEGIGGVMLVVLGLILVFRREISNQVKGAIP